ncbi:MAG: single-stranded DNA-binding protein [Candidatus Berkelbacteria bacterium]|nr:MAG: single-stranded DNA-binding protein [Candidatus Berkelbacteria bacterium]QQG51629.1 MAG: single-stranded DNA-binding protein [Candidatus Berkelbacteria bacterium]
MFSLNRAEVLGNLTRDPEVRTLPSGQTVTNFAVATNRRWKDKDGNMKEDTQYHEISVWGRLGELASQMLSKGKKVYVEGRLSTTSWEGQDGVKRQKTEIVADNFIPLAPKGDGTGFNIAEATDEDREKPAPKAKKEDKKEEKESADEINLDDIPF